MNWPASRLHHWNGVRSKYKGSVTGFETNLQASVYQTRAISMEEPACRPATKEQESLIQSPMYSLMSFISHLGSRKRVLVRVLEYYGSHPVTSLVTHILNYLDACAWILPFRVLWILWVCQESVMSNIWSSRSKYGRSSYVYENATWKKKWSEKGSNEPHLRITLTHAVQ